MAKRIYEEPKIEVIAFENVSDIVTWSNGDPSNIEGTEFDDSW